MNWFWTGFWPNLASTLIGVIIGVPIALWLTSRSYRKVELAKQTQDGEILVVCLQAIEASLTYNQEQLKTFMDLLPLNQVMFNLDLDSGAWASLKDLLIPLAKKPEFQRKLGHHFLRLEVLRKLSSQYLEMHVGVTSALGGVAATRVAFQNYLTHWITVIQVENHELLCEVRALLVNPSHA